MKLKLKRPLIIFDLETTGLDMVKDKIIQIGYIKVFPDGHEDRRCIYVDPGVEISEEITAITGITNDDIAGQPTFKEIAPKLQSVFEGCDFAGFNSNHFDIPMLAEEFLKAGIDFDFSKCRLVDVQTIFHKMERRNLEAAYKFYCGRSMRDDFAPHQADNDTEATYSVLQGQLDMYSAARQESEDRQLPNDIDALAEFSKTNDNVDFAGRIIWKELPNAKGEKVRQEVFNFGKYKGKPVAEVLRRDPGYYSWMQNGDFPLNTKQVLTRIRLRELTNK